MTEALRPDLCIVGAGPGGLAAAGAAALFGVPVVLVDTSPPAAEHPHASVLAAKALAIAATQVQAARRAHLFGVACGTPAVDGAAVHKRASELIERLARNDAPERLQALGVHLLKAAAAFTDPRTLRAGALSIQARRFILATGSRPALPAIPGLESVPLHTPGALLRAGLDGMPASVAILGASSAGFELAQAYRRLGADVTLLDIPMRDDENLFASEDREIVAIAATALAREGVTIIRHAEVERLEAIERDGRPAVALRLREAGAPGSLIEARTLVLAAGRAPALAGLDLHLADIAADETGIRVDRGLRTSNHRVYAIGGCVNGPFAGAHLPQAEEFQAGLAIRHALFRLPVRADRGAIPRVTFTDPEIASVGLGEDDARRHHRAVRIARWPFFENDRAQAERATEGHVKAVATGSGRVLGAAIVGPRAGELIQPWAVAVAKGLNLMDLAALPTAYPAFAETSKRAAVSSLAAHANNSGLRRLIRLLRSFG